MPCWWTSTIPFLFLFLKSLSHPTRLCFLTPHVLLMLTNLFYLFNTFCVLQWKLSGPARSISILWTTLLWNLINYIFLYLIFKFFLKLYILFTYFITGVKNCVSNLLTILLSFQKFLENMEQWCSFSFFFFIYFMASISYKFTNNIRYIFVLIIVFRKIINNITKLLSWTLLIRIYSHCTRIQSFDSSHLYEPEIWFTHFSRFSINYYTTRHFIVVNQNI